MILFRVAFITNIQGMTTTKGRRRFGVAGSKWFTGIKLLNKQQ
jgi:hypothetical protein